MDWRQCLPTQVASIYGDVLDCECGELEDVRAIDARWQVVWDIAFDRWLDKLVTGTLDKDTIVKKKVTTLRQGIKIAFRIGM